MENGMKKTHLLQEIRTMRFEELYVQRTEGNLTIEEAAKILGIDERTFRRWSLRYEAEGATGLADGRLDKIAHNAASVDEVTELLILFETRYPKFTVAHFYDKYRDEHKGVRCYTWVKNQLQEAGLVNKAKKRGAHRRKREREPMTGMMLHQDGSTHAWIPSHYWDLIVTMDDADSKIYSAFFVEEEGTFSSFQGIKEVIEKQGLFCSLYTDRGSHYWNTHKAGEKVDKVNLTQFGRAMQYLAIEMIPAYSPEARGRSERMFGTLQGRLPKELALEGICDMKKANMFLKEKYLAIHNARFTVKAKSEESAFVPWVKGNTNLEDILCLQESRIVNKDNTVSYKSKILQIPKDNYRYHYAKKTVTLHEYADNRIGIFFGHRCLGYYDQKGNLIT
jgi:transposase